MCWSLCFAALEESARDNVTEVARRIDREAKKKRDESMESVLQSVDVEAETSNTNSEAWRTKQLIQSFERYWSASKWVESAVQDAIEYSKDRTPRDPEQLDTEESVEERSPLLQAFNENILPALKNRGWKQESPSDSNRKKRALIGARGESVSTKSLSIHRYTIVSIISSVIWYCRSTIP